MCGGAEVGAGPTQRAAQTRGAERRGAAAYLLSEARAHNCSGAQRAAQRAETSRVLTRAILRAITNLTARSVHFVFNVTTHQRFMLNYLIACAQEFHIPSISACVQCSLHFISLPYPTLHYTTLEPLRSADVHLTNMRYNSIGSAAVLYSNIRIYIVHSNMRLL